MKSKISKTSKTSFLYKGRLNHLDALAIAMLSPRMMDRVRFETGTGTGTATTPAATTPAPAAQSPVDFAAALAKLDAIQSGIPSAVEGTLRKHGLIKDQEPTQQQQTQPPASNEPKNKDRITALENQLKERDEQLAAKTRKSAMSSAIDSVTGLDEAGKTLLTNHIRAEYGADIKVVGDDVFVENAQLGRVPLNQLVAQVAASNVGQKLIAPPKLPSGDGLKGTGTSGTASGTGSTDPYNLATKTYAEVRSFAQTNPKAFSDFIVANPAAWNRIQASGGR